MPGCSLYSLKFYIEFISPNLDYLKFIQMLWTSVPDASSCTLSHLFCYCPRLHKFWTDFFEILTGVLGVRIRMDPLIAIFGSPTEQLHVGSLQLEVLAFTSLGTTSDFVEISQSPIHISLAQGRYVLYQIRKKLPHQLTSNPAPRLIPPPPFFYYYFFFVFSHCFLLTTYFVLQL